VECRRFKLISGPNKWTGTTNDELERSDGSRRTAGGGKKEINGRQRADGSPHESEEESSDEKREHRHAIRGADLALGNLAEDAIMIRRGGVAVQNAIDNMTHRGRCGEKQQRRQQAGERRFHQLPQSADGSVELHAGRIKHGPQIRASTIFVEVKARIHPSAKTEMIQASTSLVSVNESEEGNGKTAPRVFGARLGDLLENDRVIDFRPESNHARTRNRDAQTE